MFKVLSIDGGGIRGVIPAVLLSHLEKETGKSVAEMFDLIVGT
ncbi:MAG TPA: patatin, partial [Alphaproteobacteria bacterium]|nr:patatin [Alphaproteobacteria bacterium]